MGNLFVIFIVQVILWILLFFFIYYFVKKNTELKKEIKLLKDAGIGGSDPKGGSLGNRSEKRGGS